MSWVGRADRALRVSHGEKYPDETIDLDAPDVLRITIVTATGNWSRGFEADGKHATQANVTECDLHNASYSVNFVFKYPEEKHAIHITEWMNKVTRTNMLPDTLESSTSYCAVMDALGKLLVGGSG